VTRSARRSKDFAASFSYKCEVNMEFDASTASPSQIRKHFELVSHDASYHLIVVGKSTSIAKN
jgi:hypothetical protein